jgi:3-hydroxy-9,10-secoandrosta-1,3,5(10)-triene-9,17-dione monooxygenase
MTNAPATLLLPGSPGADLLARAQALVPNLARRVHAATEARNVPDETIAEFRRAGILRVLQPRRFGGYQESVGVFLQIVEALTEGCASSAWVYGVLGELQWVIALLPEQGQDDIWGDAPEAVAAGSLVPRASARRCQGGWRVTGRYSFASGCMHAQWAIICARCEDAAGNEPPRYLVVPTGDIEIVDDWHSLGMQGTGSRSLAFRDVFVPEHRSVALRDVLDGTPPGREVHPDYQLLRAPRYYLVPFVLPAVAFALARKALSLLPPSLHARGMAPSDILHLQLGEAAAHIETANLIFATRRAESVGRLDAGEPIEDASVLRNRRDVTLAFGLLKKGVERLVAINGARTVYDNDPLQSVLLDITAISTHIIVNEQAAMVPYGRWMMERAESE